MDINLCPNLPPLVFFLSGVWFFMPGFKSHPSILVAPPLVLNRITTYLRRSYNVLTVLWCQLENKAVSVICSLSVRRENEWERKADESRLKSILWTQSVFRHLIYTKMFECHCIRSIKWNLKANDAGAFLCANFTFKNFTYSFLHLLT